MYNTHIFMQPNQVLEINIIHHYDVIATRFAFSHLYTRRAALSKDSHPYNVRELYSAATH